jgi:hypothetical protein
LCSLIIAESDGEASIVSQLDVNLGISRAGDVKRVGSAGNGLFHGGSSWIIQNTISLPNNWIRESPDSPHEDDGSSAAKFNHVSSK